MTLLGENLTAPKLAAIALAVYAVCYVVLLLFAVGLFLPAPMSSLLFFGLLALATAPFFAITHLNRVTRQGGSPPARPVVMTVVMAVPTAFWLYASATSVTPLYYIQFADVVWIVGFILVPALLALWLTVTFAMLAFSGRTKTVPRHATDASDIE